MRSVLHVRVHGAADVEEQQHLHGVVALGNHADVEELRVARRRADRVVEVQLVGGAGSGELAQAAQRHLDVARAEFDAVVEITEIAPVPHLHGAPVAAVGAHANALGMVALLPEG